MAGVKGFIKNISTEYKIRSTRILGGCILSTFLIIFAIFFAEILIDLKITDAITLLPFLALNSLLFIGYLLGFNTRILAFLWVATQFITVETHFLLNPRSYHAILFWFAFIPIGALITNGIRNAYLWLLMALATVILNAYFGLQVIGKTYDITIIFIPFIVAVSIFIIGIFASVYLLYKLLGDAYQREEENTRALEDKKRRLEKYQNALIGLSKDKAATEGNLESLFETICQLAVKNLEVSRVSVWTIENKPQGLHRKYLFEVSGGTDEVVVLERRDFPRYFHALETKTFIAADDARTNVNTSEFTESYLKPLNIYSMLDSPITIDRELIGVICCEHQQQPRVWSAEDILFVQSLSDIIALGFKTYQINSLLQKIRSQNNELLEKQNEIETLNEELNASNEELTTMNESLELAVSERTKELEQQNKQLTEYAFINSHLLRAPLSRILGLCQLLSTTKSTDPALFSALLQSSEELDTIIRKISDLLYDGQNFSREEIKAIIEKNFNKLDKK